MYATKKQQKIDFYVKTMNRFYNETSKLSNY